MNYPRHKGQEELEQGLAQIKAAPCDVGTVEMIVRRPQTDAREVLDEGQLDTRVGLVGDNWFGRGGGRTADGQAHPDMQLNLMGSRVIELVAGEREYWSLAGDQFFVDLNLSKDNLPAGTRLEIGEAVIEVTAEPHLGCKKFTERFGIEAMKFVNSGLGKSLCLRGINAKVVRPGRVRQADKVARLT